MFKVLNCANGPSFEKYKILDVNEVLLGSFDSYTEENVSWQWEHIEPDNERNVIDPSPLFMAPRWKKDCSGTNTEVVMMLATAAVGKRKRNRLPIFPIPFLINISFQYFT